MEVTCGNLHEDDIAMDEEIDGARTSDRCRRIRIDLKPHVPSPTIAKHQTSIHHLLIKKIILTIKAMRSPSCNTSRICRTTSERRSGKGSGVPGDKWTA